MLAKVGLTSNSVSGLARIRETREPEPPPDRHESSSSSPGSRGRFAAGEVARRARSGRMPQRLLLRPEFRRPSGFARNPQDRLLHGEAEGSDQVPRLGILKVCAKALLETDHPCLLRRERL